MNNWNIPETGSLPQESQKMLDEIKQKVGKEPNIYKIMGHSPHALKAYLEAPKMVMKGELTDKEEQAVYLATSEINGCEYCLAAHTAAAKNSGFSEEETQELRTGEIEDEKLRALTRFVRQVVETRGKPRKEYVNDFLDVGYNKAAMMDVLMLVSIKTFANYVHGLSGCDVDYPEAKSVEHVTATS